MRERLLGLMLVIVLHLALAYAALYLSVRNELIELPSSISVRLLPILPEPRVEPTPPPPKIVPQAHRTPTPAQPVLAVPTQAAPSSSFLVAPQPPVPPAPVPVQLAPPAPVSVVAARFDADYLHNPKPVYPAISRRNGEEGKVLLRVRVSAQGTALDLSITKSSGFTRLDNAAQEAVGHWRFVPAKRGDESVESSVIVPITFALE